MIENALLLSEQIQLRGRNAIDGGCASVSKHAEKASNSTEGRKSQLVCGVVSRAEYYSGVEDCQRCANRY